MEKSLCKNHGNIEVTYKFTRKVDVFRYIKSSGVWLVSIKASIVPILHKKCIFNLLTFFNFWSSKECQRNQINNPNIWEFFSFAQLIWAKFSDKRQYGEKNVNKSITFEFKIKSHLKQKQIYFLKRKVKYCDSNILKSRFIDCIDRSGLILLGGDVEKNPGPSPGTSLVINSYNVRGLKEYSKLKRTLNKCANLISKNSNEIFNIQETHLGSSDEGKIQLMWRGNFALSPGGNKSRGCLTLYDTSWVTLNKYVDQGGRFSIITVQKQFGTFTIVNLYAPNEQSIEFFEEVFLEAIRLKDQYNSELIIAGDFNLVMDSAIDSVNRTQTPHEKIVGTFVKDSIGSMGLIDSYRKCHPSCDGFTWSRGNCLSRLDMIFIPKNSNGDIKNSKLDWAFDKSDHALISSEISFNSTNPRGPGLPKVDTNLLKKPDTVAEIKTKLSDVITQIPTSWDPHKVWDYIKVMIRSIFWEVKSKQKKVDNCEEEALISQLNLLKSNKSKILSMQPNGSSVDMDGIESCIKDIENELHTIWVNKSKILAFNARVKWFNDGEKSNRYFLNIIKKRQAEMTINILKNGNVEAEGQTEVQEMVKEFYSELYSARTDLSSNYESFYPADLPKLNDEERTNLDARITMAELENTLKSCKDSAPGPDGITYSVYGTFWDIIGQPFLNAWEYSRVIGELPDNQRRSTITLLPKAGKDTSQISNWRPITLTNCDLKVITKTIANRVSKVLDKIISPTQTAYIPGRVVQDNLRMFEFYRKYCQENNVDGILMSMDAKKAFDSVDHKYMFKTLKAYGFSDEFIEIV